MSEDTSDIDFASKIEEMATAIKDLRDRIEALEAKLAEKPTKRKTHLKSILTTILVVAAFAAVIGGSLIYALNVGLF